MSLLETHGYPGAVGQWAECYLAEPVKNCSEQKRDNGHAQGWVVTELLQVAAVLALGPDSHLGEAHQGEEGHCGQNRVSDRDAHRRAGHCTGTRDSPGTHCVMMAKPIQDPTCGQHNQGEGTEGSPGSYVSLGKEGSSGPRLKLHFSPRPTQPWEDEGSQSSPHKCSWDRTPAETAR